MFARVGGLHGRVGRCLMYIRSMLHVISVICYSMRILFAHHTTANWWWDLGHSSTQSEVWGDWELGC